jgi:creatinine amidohydrolase
LNQLKSREIEMNWSLKKAPMRTWILGGAVAVAAALPMAIPAKTLTADLPETVHMKDMTWVEVRSALQAGYASVIVPTGGIEQNGPHMILGKHDYLVTFAAQRIAKAAGRTLVAPVVSFVPEGGFDPPTGHMRFPGTIGVSDAAFAGVLDGISRSLKLAGFKNIFVIGDHGQSQTVQAQVAKRLSEEWKSAGVRVIHVPEYYATEAQTAALQKQGLDRATIGQHASVIDTSELLAVHPKGVDLVRFSRAKTAKEATGVYGNPQSSTPELGANLLAMRIEAATARIRAEQHAH